MKIKLHYKDPTDMPKEAHDWLQNAEDKLNKEIRKKLEDYEAHGVFSVYIAEPLTEEVILDG